MSFVSWMASLPSPVLMLIVSSAFMLCLLLLLIVSFSSRATGRIVRVINALRGMRGRSRCSHGSRRQGEF